MEILSTTLKSSDENLLNTSVRMDPNAIGETSFSGICDVKFDMYDTTMVSVAIYIFLKLSVPNYFFIINIFS